MICHHSKCIFVHVPKTGGQSIERAFLEARGLSWEERSVLLLRPNDNLKKGPPRLAHLTASKYTELDHVAPKMFREYFKFGFVRNPWKRLISEYNFRQLGGSLEFKAWLLNDFPTPGWSDAYRHVMPQSDYLYDSTGRCLVDFIGRFERFEKDVSMVLDRVGISGIDLRHSNSSRGKIARLALMAGLQFGNRRRSLRCYYDDETIKWVAKKYSEDIQRFGYKFNSQK